MLTYGFWPNMCATKNIVFYYYYYFLISKNVVTFKWTSEEYDHLMIYYIKHPYKRFQKEIELKNIINMYFKILNSIIARLMYEYKMLNDILMSPLYPH